MKATMYIEKIYTQAELKEAGIIFENQEVDSAYFCPVTREVTIRIKLNDVEVAANDPR